MWAAANNILGSSWVLIIKIVTTTKSILKFPKKKLKGHALTFSPNCGTRNMSGGHFLSRTTQRVPPAKRQKLSKQFEHQHQTFVDLTVLGNHHGSNKSAVFLENIRLIISAPMWLEKCLVVLPYPDCHTSSKCRPFQGNASTISGVTKLCMYLEKLRIREGVDVTVKKFVAHDTPLISLNTVEFATPCNDFDSAVSISCIQASATSKAGYLLGSQKTMNDKHWKPFLNANPRLVKLDVQVVKERIQVNTSAPWNPKTGAY